MQNVYGLHAVRAALLRHPERVGVVRLAEGRDDPRMREIEKLARESGRTLERVNGHRLKQLVGEAVHQGVLAEVETMRPWSEDDLLDAAGSATAPLLLALDGVQDPHNLG